MANAAAKKAAAAKAQASSFYKPLLIGINVVYVIVRYTVGDGFANLGVSSYFLLLIFVALQAYAYLGIMENAANRKANDKSLVGGSNLDLLAVVYLAQFGGMLISRKFYYLLVLLPVWGAYSLYINFFGGTKKTAAIGPDDDGVDASDDPRQTGRRQKRAEKRRQKWS